MHGKVNPKIFANLMECNERDKIKLNPPVVLKFFTCSLAHYSFLGREVILSSGHMDWALGSGLMGRPEHKNYGLK